MSQQKKQSVFWEGYRHGDNLGFRVSMTEESLRGPSQCAQSLLREQLVHKHLWEQPEIRCLTFLQ